MKGNENNSEYGTAGPSPVKIHHQKGGSNSTGGGGSINGAGVTVGGGFGARGGSGAKANDMTDARAEGAQGNSSSMLA